MNPYVNAHVRAAVADQRQGQLLRQAETARLVRQVDVSGPVSSRRRFAVPRLRRRRIARVVVATT